jgi:hypothetical protein
MENYMSRRVDETLEEYRARHAAEERARREDPEYAEKIRAHRQRADVKARHAELERERRKSKQVQAYAREYQRNLKPEQKERARQYRHEWYLQNKERTKEARAAWGKANREKTNGYVKEWEKRNPLRSMFHKAKACAKPRGLEFTITLEDLVWPVHCPILGIKLCYERDKKTPHRDDYPTFDRWDNSKGYVPGNVFIISWRANRMKWHSTLEELEAIVRYMKERPSLAGIETVDMQPALQTHARARRANEETL